MSVKVTFRQQAGSHTSSGDMGQMSIYAQGRGSSTSATFLEKTWPKGRAFVEEGGWIEIQDGEYNPIAWVSASDVLVVEFVDG